jgi:hypothetical protein
MQHINGAYTNYFSTKRKRAGHLFQGRYKAILVDADAYAQELSRYIHLNPVRAGIVKKPAAYEWSGYGYYINLKQSTEWIHTEFILGLFSRRASVARKQYHQFVESMVGCEYESPLKNIFASTILGGRSFINEIRSRYVDRKSSTRDLSDLRCFYEMPAIKNIIKGVEKIFGDDPAMSRRIQLYVCHRYSGKKLKEISEHFEIGESGVSQASRRVAQQIKKDKKLKKCIVKIVSDLELSKV